MEWLVIEEEEVDKAAWEGSRAVDHALHLLTLWFNCQMHAFYAKHSLYTLDGGKLLEWSAAKHLKITAPALPLVFPFL